MSPAFRTILIVSGVLKIALAVTFADLEPRYDEVEYLEFGRAVLDGEPPRLWRAPGYQWLVAAGLAVDGGSTAAVRILQALLSVAASWLAYRIGRRQWGETAGLAAGTFLAFYPSHVAFAHYLWSEVLYGFLALFAFERLLAADRDRSVPAALAAGALLGAAALTRSLGLALLVVSAGWLAVRGRNLRLAGLALAAGVVVVAPWSIRASALAGRPVAVDVNGAFNVWSGNNEYIPPEAQGIWSVGLPLRNGLHLAFDRWAVDGAWRQEVLERMTERGVQDQLGPDGADWYRAEALRNLRADPAAALGRVPKKLAALWSPDLFLPRHLVRDWYGETSPALAAALVALTWLACAVPLLAGPGALAALPAGRFRSLTLVWIVLYLGVHALAYGHSRMHQPLVPLLVLAVAGLTLDAAETPRWRRVLRRAAPWTALALAAWIFVWPVYGGIYLAPGPRHAGVARVVAAGRHLPLPGAERLTWMLAAVEGSRGEPERARRVLEGGRHAEEPWSLYLRALVTEDRSEMLELLDRAVRADPDLHPAVRLRQALRARSSLP